MKYHRYLGKTTGIALILVVMFGNSIAIRAAGIIIHVNSAVPAGGNGRSWKTAFNSLSDALETAEDGDCIWVAAGTYYPTTDDNRGISFVLKKGVSLYGGFKVSESRLSERDWKRNRTILSGDIGRSGLNSDNSYHVVIGADDAVLDGFIITGGYSQPGGRSSTVPGVIGGPGQGRQPVSPGLPGERRGRTRQRPPFIGGPGGRQGRGTELPLRPGGRRAIHTSPQEIMRGAGIGQGAGLLNYQAAPTIRNCIFQDNRGRKGGGVYNMTSTEFPPRPENFKIPVFIGCIFRKNSALGRGGGVSNDLGTSPVFLNCIFEENETPQKGGGMYNDFGCSPILINCLFTGNSAGSAAAMGNDGGSSPVLHHCTFTKNHAEDAGPSLYQGTGPANNPTIIRCIVWGNSCRWESKGLYNWHDCTPSVKESVIEGGFPGTGNSSKNPRLNQEGVSALDCGYKTPAQQFRESELPRLLMSLKAVRASRSRTDEKPDKKTIPHSNRVIYVNGRNMKKGDGKQWLTAYRSLQDAITDASRDGAEIWAAAGTYTPSSTDRSASFILSPGIRLYGGFAGVETQRGQRNVEKNSTILSGDIGKPGVKLDNAYHVVTGADEAVLDGFKVTGGYADGIGYDGKGGGIINYQKGKQSRPNDPYVSGYSPTVENCIFSGNYARDGGAVYNYDRNTPRFVGCVFESNSADNGGAVLDRVGVEAVYQNCKFTGNTATWRGGAMYFDYGSRPNLDKCTFQENSTGGHGGALYSLSRASQLENTTLTITNCRFEKNQSSGNGGAAAFHDSTIASVSNSSFRANVAGQSGGAFAVTERASIESSGNIFNGNQAGKDGPDIYRDSSAPASEQGTSPRSASPPTRSQGAASRAAQHVPVSDFSVITIGTGGPQYNPERAGPCTVIQYKGNYIVVDMGNGTQARLHEKGVPTNRISALIFTHHHHDHNEELIPLLIQTRLQNTAREIIGPAGTRQYVNFILSFYEPDIAYRAQRRGRPIKEMLNVNVREIQGGRSLELGGLRISTAEVNHTIYCLAYRFDCEGKSIVISGDTSYSENLITLAKNSDIMIMDSGALIRVNSPANRRRRPNQRRTQTSQNTLANIKAHSSLEEVANMAQKANVKQVVLTHFTPDLIDREATLREFKKIYNGQIIFSQDLLEFSPR